MKTEINFTRINNDVNGNPRYVCHYFEFITDTDREEPDYYSKDANVMALKRAKQLGGRKFHNKQYGGGIVFQSYNIQDLDKEIKKMMQNLISVSFYMETGNGTDSATPVAVWKSGSETLGRVSCYAHIGQHSEGMIEYFEALKPAKPKQYKDLKKELESIGYYVEVCN